MKKNKLLAILCLVLVLCVVFVYAASITKLDFVTVRDNLTVEDTILIGTDAPSNHTIYANATATIITGPTSKWIIE